jgi:rhomboid protease GluP
MEWSLVLASQDIEHAIEEGNGTFALVLGTEDEATAAAAIRAYEQENTTVWRREVKWTGLLFDSRSAMWWVAVALWFLVAEERPALKQAGTFASEQFKAGEWWRAFTAVTLHADLPHLALNCVTGFVLLGLAMGFYGAGRALLAAFVAGAAANATELFLRGEAFRSLGASGMVFGALGLLAAQSLVERHTSAREWIGRGVLAASLLLVLLGLDVRSDILAHVLGFGFGLVIGLPLCWTTGALRSRRWIDRCCVLGTVALVVLAWTLALRL